MRSALLLTYVLITTSLLLASTVSAQREDYTPSDAVRIDYHWIDVFQENDRKTLNIDEYFLVNNTGDEPLFDEFYVWLPSNGNIFAKCCGNAPDMGCRFREGGGMACFNFARVNENVHLGEPFTGNSITSYFGQSEQLEITVSSATDPLNNDTLLLNVTLGGSSAARGTDNFDDAGLHISSSNKNIGIIAPKIMDMPLNITAFENITLFNNGTASGVFDININGLAEGWKAELRNGSKDLSNITLLPGQGADLTLVISAPSYMTTVKISYTTQMSTKGEERVTATFDKQYIYSTGHVEYFAFLLSDKDLEVSPDLAIVHPIGGGEPEWNDNSQRFWYVIHSEDVLTNSLSTMTIGWESSPDNGNNLIILAVILILAALVIVPIMRKKGLIGSKGEAEGTPRPTEKKESLHSAVENDRGSELDRLQKERKKLLSKIERIETDAGEGILTKDMADELKGPILLALQSNQKKRDKLSRNEGNRVISSKSDTDAPGDSSFDDTERVRLQTHLNHLKAVKQKLDGDRKEGLLPEDLYVKLSSRYEKTASETKITLDNLEKVQNSSRKKIQRAIERLKKDREDGVLKEDVFLALMKDYENGLNELDDN